IEDLEHEMNVDAQATAEFTATRRAKATAAHLSQDQTDYKDRYLRNLADFENFRKRSERENTDYFKYALAGLMTELLPVLDNFDRALDHAEQGDDFHRGVLLIYKQLYDVLKKHGLRPIEESGVP